MAVLEMYIWLGALLFYAVEFHDVNNEDAMSPAAVNKTDILAKLEKLKESMLITLHWYFLLFGFL